MTPEAVACAAEPTPAVAPVRRLSHVELENTITDVLGLGATARAVAASLAGDPISLGFRNSSAFLDVKPVLAQQYMDGAERIATEYLAKAGVVPCDPAKTGETACATTFINAVGRRLYRRSLTAAETARYVAVYTKGRTYDFKTGLTWVVFTLLQSPQFLYRWELDTGVEGSVRHVTGLELASRLASFLWHSAPDDALLDAAEQGRLETNADLDREVSRMLTDPRTRRVSSFFEEWLDLDELDGFTRDKAIYPNLNANLPTLFKGEGSAFVNSVVFDGDHRFSTLMTAPYTMVNAPLAAHYGLTGVTGEAFQRVTLPAGRAGLFMLGGVLSVHDKENRTSIVKRGLRVRTQLLCQTVSAPPPNVPGFTTVDQSQTQADRLAQHRTNPACAGCHTLMDPLGSPFESVDAVGRSRTKDENGFTLATTGELRFTKSSDSLVTDGADLLAKISTSDEAQDCFLVQMYRYGNGRQETTLDACSLSQLRTRFRQTGGDVTDMLKSFTQLDDFLYRRVTPGDGS
jgi:hypothetical protein